MSLQVLLLIWLGFALLSTAMPRHCMDILPGRKLSRIQQRLLQLVGALLLAVSCYLAIQADGLHYGLTGWTGLLTLALVVLVVLLSYRPSWLPGSCLAAVAAVAML